MFSYPERVPFTAFCSASRVKRLEKLLCGSRHVIDGGLRGLSHQRRAVLVEVDHATSLG